jgi:hypothetical protein
MRHQVRPGPEQVNLSIVTAVVCVPAPLVDQARASFAVAIHAGGSIGAHARDAFVTGIHTGLLYAAGAAIVAAVSVATLLRNEDRPRQVSCAGKEREVAHVTEHRAPDLGRGIAAVMSIGRRS